VRFPERADAGDHVEQELKRLEKRHHDLLIGFMNLTDCERRGEDVRQRRQAHGRKFGLVSRRIFELRQRRLL
jgi:hypothetical protein